MPQRYAFNKQIKTLLKKENLMMHILSFNGPPCTNKFGFYHIFWVNLRLQMRAFLSFFAHTLLLSPISQPVYPSDLDTADRNLLVNMFTVTSNND